MQLYTTTLGSACVIVVVVFLLYSNRFINDLSWDNPFVYQIILAIVFGVLSIFGAVSATEVDGATCNVLDLAPAFAGLAGGPIAGIGAGLIGGVFCLAHGGFTTIAASISSLLSGLICGFIFLFAKETVIKPVWGLVIGMVIEAAHMGLILLASQPFEQALSLVQIIMPPMLIFNALGLFCCLLVNRHLAYRWRLR